MFRSLVFSFQLLVHNEETRLRGVVVVVDVKGLTLRQVRQFYPSILKKVADLLNVRYYNLIYKIVILSLLKIQCPKGRVPHSHCRNPCRL